MTIQERAAKVLQQIDEIALATLCDQWEDGR